MLSKKLKNLFDEVDRKDPTAAPRRALYGVFLDIAQAIPRMRAAKGISQRELARRLETSHPTIVRWETPGYSGYTLSKLVDVAEALDYRVEIKFSPIKSSKATTEVNNIGDDTWSSNVKPAVDQEENVRRHPGLDSGWRIEKHKTSGKVLI